MDRINKATGASTNSQRQATAPENLASQSTNYNLQYLALQARLQDANRTRALAAHMAALPVPSERFVAASSVIHRALGNQIPGFFTLAQLREATITAAHSWQDLHGLEDTVAAIQTVCSRPSSLHWREDLANCGDSGQATYVVPALALAANLPEMMKTQGKRWGLELFDSDQFQRDGSTAARLRKDVYARVENAVGKSATDRVFQELAACVTQCLEESARGGSSDHSGVPTRVARDLLAVVHQVHQATLAKVLKAVLQDPY